MASKKLKWILLLSLTLGLCFVSVINMPYETVVQKQVEEEYVTVEPYTVQEEVEEPYTAYVDHVYWKEYSDYERQFKAGSGHFVTETVPVTKYRTVSKEVTKYREVTETRLVYRPVVETQTRRVSILRYLLR